MSKLEKGKELFKAAKFEEALALFSSFLKDNKEHGDALFFRGLAYRKTEQFQKSVDDLSLLINRLPDTADLYSERGVSYFHLKEYKTALNDMNKAVELEPENSYRYSSRAYIRGYLDIDGAIKDYEKATQLDPKDDIAYNNLGLMLEKQGKLKQAQQKFKKSNEITGYDPDAKKEVEPEVKKEVVAEQPKIDANPTESSIGRVMLDVFRNKETRKEYFNFLKTIFKKSN